MRREERQIISIGGLISSIAATNIPRTVNTVYVNVYNTGIGRIKRDIEVTDTIVIDIRLKRCTENLEDARDQFLMRIYRRYVVRVTRGTRNKRVERRRSN